MTEWHTRIWSDVTLTCASLLRGARQVYSSCYMAERMHKLISLRAMEYEQLAIILISPIS